MTTSNWLEARTPHDLSITANLVIQDLILVWGQLEKILGKGADGSVSSGHSSALSSRNTLSHFSTQSRIRSPLERPKSPELLHILRLNS